MWMWPDTPPAAATRNIRSISDMGAPGVYALPKPMATAPCASPSRRMASMAAICTSVADPLPPMPAGRSPVPGSPRTLIRAGICPMDTP